MRYHSSFPDVEKEAQRGESPCLCAFHNGGDRYPLLFSTDAVDLVFAMLPAAEKEITGMKWFTVFFRSESFKNLLLLRS